MVLGMANPDNVKDVLAVIGLYEDGDIDCNNALLDRETGLCSATVDEVLDYLWRMDQIEGVTVSGDRNPSLDDVRARAAREGDAVGRRGEVAGGGVKTESAGELAVGDLHLN
jgi:hypothetical protein